MDAGRIDLADIAEVRRRVVEPVLANLLRPGEATDVELLTAHDWPRDPDERWPAWMDSPFATRPGDAPASLFLVLRGSRGDRHTARLGEIGFFRTDVIAVVDRLTGSLEDWIAERDPGRGEARTLSGGVSFPPAVTQVEGRPVVLLEMGADGRPELEVGGTPTPPAALGLHPDLLADLDAWLTALDADLENTFRALERVQQARFDAEFARPAGFRVVMAPRKKAAAARKRADKALAEVHLGRWSRLVAEHEPRRDRLLARLRSELGPGFHVPIPARIPS